MDERVSVTIYTDGSYKRSSGNGGYAGILTSGSHILALAGQDTEAKGNDAMELKAIVQSLKQVNRPADIHLISDSTYVVDGVNRGAAVWRDNNWKVSSGKQAANIELWEEYLQLIKGHFITATWIKSHKDKPVSVADHANAMCDMLAQDAADGNV